MPIDFDLAIALAAKATAGLPNGSPIKSVAFDLDPLRDLADLEKPGRVTIAPFNLDENREARGNWSADIELVLTMVLRAPKETDQQRYAEYFDLWDQIVRSIRADNRVTDVESEGRYRVDQQANHKRLVSQKIITLNTTDIDA